MYTLQNTGMIFDKRRSNIQQPNFEREMEHLNYSYIPLIPVTNMNTK